MVVTTAGRALSARIDTHLIVGPLGIGHLHALDTLVDTDDSAPVGAHLRTEGRFSHYPGATVGIVQAVGAIVVVDSWQVLHTLRLRKKPIHCGYHTSSIQRLKATKSSSAHPS